MIKLKYTIITHLFYPTLHRVSDNTTTTVTITKKNFWFFICFLYFPPFFQLYCICIVSAYSHYILYLLPFNSHLLLVLHITIHSMLTTSPYESHPPEGFIGTILPDYLYVDSSLFSLNLEISFTQYKIVGSHLPLSI